MDKDRQIFQLHQKGYENIAKGLKDLKPNPEAVQKIEIPGVSVITLKGDPGDDGETPEKGIDYFTAEEIKEISDEIFSRIQVPDPIPGKDAVVDYTLLKGYIVDEVSKIKIPEPIPGKDAVIDYKAVVESVLKKIPKTEVDYISIEKIIVENIQKMEERIVPRYRTLNSGGPTTRLGELVDVDIEGVTDGQALIYDAELQRWVPGEAGTVDSVNGETGDVVLDTDDIDEGATNEYFTEARVRATPLTGLSVTGGAVTATDTVLQAFGKTQNQINGLIGGVTYEGTWNASTNTPTLASGVGSQGNYYVVSADGATNLDGITDWKIGDWAIFNGTVWQKVDNTEVPIDVDNLNPIEVGFTNTASGCYSSAIGYCNSTTTLNSVVGGRSNFTGTGIAAVSYGILNNQSGGTLTASTGVIGGTPVAANAGCASTAFGICNLSSAILANSFGFKNTASACCALAMGVTNTASGAASSAVGASNTVSGLQGQAFGSGNTVSSTDAAGCVLAYGIGNVVASRYSSAFGHGNAVNYSFNSSGSLALGRFNTICQSETLGVGYLNTACAFGSQAVGTANRSCGVYSTAVGVNNTSSSTYSNALGYTNIASAACTAAVGALNTASVIQGTALGVCNCASANTAIAMGFLNCSSGVSSIGVGVRNAMTTCNSQGFGRFNYSGTGLGAVALGLLNNQTTATYAPTTAVITGTSAGVNAGCSSLAVGTFNTATGYLSRAIGYSNVSSGCCSTAFGNANTASGCNSHAFGANISNALDNTWQGGWSDLGLVQISSNRVYSVPQGLNTTKTNRASVGGVIFDHYVDASVGGAEADIYTDTLVADLLSTNGDKVTATYAGKFETVGTELVQLKALFAGNTMFDSGTATPLTGSNYWKVMVDLIRVSSTVLRYVVTLKCEVTGFTLYTTSGELTGQTFTGTNVLKITGTSSGVGSGAGDIIGNMSSGMYLPAWA